jgi:3-hydroxyisobutyrate dehydrogenase/glyoxylate/succinic semialdehyde reductase
VEIAEIERKKERKAAGVSHGSLMKETKMKIGFIGLGIIGSRMAANLQKHENSLVVFNRTRAKAEPLLGPCGTFSDSPAKLAEQVDVLFTMLAHPGAVEQAALNADGFLNHLRPNALWVDCSSVNPSFSKKMAAEAARREVHFVDAPVTGYRASEFGRLNTQPQRRFRQR